MVKLLAAAPSARIKEIHHVDPFITISAPGIQNAAGAEVITNKHFEVIEEYRPIR